MSKILHRPDAIREWAEARGGSPMLMDVPDPGGDRTLLQITFGQHMLDADANEGPDRATGGFRLVGWDAWLAELDRQHLAIKVNEDAPGRLDNDFRFVSRAGDGETTDAARQPPPGTVERPGQPDDEADAGPRIARFGPAPGEGRG